MLFQHLIGSYPALSANAPVQLPLRSMPPRHTCQALQLKVSCTITGATGGGNATVTDAQWDTFVASIIQSVRLVSGTLGEPINLLTANLRSIYQTAAGVDTKAVNSATNGDLRSAAIANAGTVAAVIDITIPFFDNFALEDSDWACPSTDQLAPDSFLEIKAGTLAAVTVTGTAATWIASAISVELVATLIDAHYPFIGPVQVMREQTLAQNQFTFERGLYLTLFDTRPVFGSGAYTPTYTMMKDGKPLLNSVNGASQALAYAKQVQFPGGVDLLARVGPILFNVRGYTEDDLKPSFQAMQLTIPSGFVAGTVVYRLLRGIEPGHVASVAANLGYTHPFLNPRTVLGRVDGEGDDDRIKPFKSKYILREAPPAGKRRVA